MTQTRCGQPKAVHWASGFPRATAEALAVPTLLAASQEATSTATTLAGGYTNNMPVYTLTSGEIDCTGLSGVIVEFQRWLGMESSTFDDASFQVSDNGTSWTTIWEHSGSSFTDADWMLQSFDVSAIADDSSLYLRWSIGTSDGSVTYCGWNIDDVRVLAPCTERHPVPP